jgi:hypothetical protein
MEFGSCLAVVPHNHMQDYPVVGWVLVMAVSLPIAGFDVHFYISLYNPLAGGNNCVPEISPSSIILSSWVDYPYRLTAGCSQPGSIHQPLPRFNHYPLREIIWQLTPPLFNTLSCIHSPIKAVCSRADRTFYPWLLIKIIHGNVYNVKVLQVVFGGQLDIQIRLVRQ